MQHEDIHAMAQGKWPSILPALGVPAQILDGRHHPCPICGGKDRFRFDNKEGKGTYYCHGCGAGRGVDLVMKVKDVQFIEAKKMIKGELPTATFTAPKAQRSQNPDLWRGMWSGADPLSEADLVIQNFRSRGITNIDLSSLAYLRFKAKTKYKHHDGHKSFHPAMLARFIAPDDSASTIHRTYLTSTGRKHPDLDPVRKMLPGPIPKGGAVRLGKPLETMGIAEGIETALSAAQLFDLPVWAALNDVALGKWQPPLIAKHIIIFGDCDANAAGQLAAWGLAKRLFHEGFTFEVRIPDEIGTDWNDILQSELRGAIAA